MSEPAQPYASPQGSGVYAPYVAPYTPPRPPGGGVPAPPVQAARGYIGVVALVAGLIATAGTTVVGAIAAWQIGLGAGKAIGESPRGADFDWSTLSPVRGHVLTGEVSFWIGTVLGIIALVLGIIAIVADRGRVAGIVAVVVATLGPVVFLSVVALVLSTALPVGVGIGG